MKYLFVIPSFYGLFSFGLCYLLYRVRLLPYNETFIETDFLLIIVILCLVIATLTSLSFYKKVVCQLNIHSVENINYSKAILYLYLIGFLGYALYYKSFINYFGSIGNFLIIFIDDGEYMRKSLSEIDAGAVQLTYFAWIASGASVFYFIKGKLSRRWMYIAIFHFFLNFLFMGRSRLFMILLTSTLVILPLYLNKISFKFILKKCLYISVVLIVIFNIIGLWTRKINLEDDRPFGCESILPSYLQSFYFYSTSGFAYFNEVVKHDFFDGIPIRIFNPLYKIGNSITPLDVKIPDTILDFRKVMPNGGITNVGTFLEPFYRDGGWLYTIIGIIIHSFYFNLLGLIFLKANNGFSFYAWSFLCFMNLFMCFAPRYNTVYFYVFMLMPFVYRCFKK